MKVCARKFLCNGHHPAQAIAVHQKGRAMFGDQRVLKAMGPAAVLMWSLFGCSESVKEPDWPGAVPVTGIVTIDGTALGQANVLYIPDEGTVGQGGSGTTDDTGKYKVSSRDSKGDTIEGIIPGKYRVAISRMIKPDGSVWTPDATNSTGPASVGAREELPMEYADPRSSIWLIDVISGGPSQDFGLQKK